MASIGTKPIRLNSHVYISYPFDGAEDQSQEAQKSQNYPSLVLLFGWLNAQDLHLKKYVDALRVSFPPSKILVIRCTSAYFASTQSQVEVLLAPVAEILAEEVSCSDFKGLLIHVISNGGGFNLSSLRKLLMKASDKRPCRRQSTSITPTALVLDSTPGASGLRSSLTDMTPSNVILYWLAVPPVSLLYGVYYVLNCLAGNAPIFVDLRTMLNDPNLLPGLTIAEQFKLIPRVYIYSERDRTTPFRKVEEHTQEAKDMGFDVTSVKFTNSLHVSHARTNPERYWQAVQDVWMRAVSLVDVPHVAFRAKL